MYVCMYTNIHMHMHEYVYDRSIKRPQMIIHPECYAFFGGNYEVLAIPCVYDLHIHAY